jgi:hypothetical protein
MSESNRLPVRFTAPLPHQLGHATMQVHLVRFELTRPRRTQPPQGCVSTVPPEMQSTSERNRTFTPLWALDSKSSASTCSATLAYIGVVVTLYAEAGACERHCGSSENRTLDPYQLRAGGFKPLSSSMPDNFHRLQLLTRCASLTATRAYLWYRTRLRPAVLID